MKFADDVTPADCGLDFEGILSPQSPAITGRMTELVRCRWRTSTDDCTGIRTGNDASYRERESANDTHHAHRKMTGSQPERPSTRTSSVESQHISAKVH